jgi:hypothetical protein
MLQNITQALTIQDLEFTLLDRPSSVFFTLDPVQAGGNLVFCLPYLMNFNGKL